MSNGYVRNSKKACGDRAAGRAVHIDDILSRESGPARMFKFEGYDRQTPPELADGEGIRLPTTLLRGVPSPETPRWRRKTREQKGNERNPYFAIQRLRNQSPYVVDTPRPTPQIPAKPVAPTTGETRRSKAVTGGWQRTSSESHLASSH
jgi:hypothetical protein